MSDRPHVTSMTIRYSTGPERKVPKVGDVKYVKKYRTWYVRDYELVHGSHVHRSGRPGYVWRVMDPQPAPPESS